MKRLLIVAALLIGALTEASAGLPVRYWSDDMAQHTFSLNAGPGWFLGNTAGVETGLRYDRSYFRGYDVALGVGATYLFSASSSRLDGGIEYGGDIRIGNETHYLGINALDVKFWFGERTVWDVCLHGGWIGGRAWSKYPGDVGRQYGLFDNGIMGGISTGLDFMITAWFGVGIHLNAMSGMIFSDGSSSEYSRAAVRLGATYCF
jgi:hypothetical protein